MNRYRGILNGISAVLLLLLGASAMVMADTVTVSIVNSQAVPIYVSFTTLNQAPGTITWNSSGSGCVNTGKGANAAYTQINAGQTCTRPLTPPAAPRGSAQRRTQRPPTA